MEQIVFMAATLVLGGAVAIGTAALSGLAIGTGLRDGRSDPQREALGIALSVLIGMVQFGYVVISSPDTGSVGDVLSVFGWTLLIGAGLGALAFLVVLCIHSARAGSERRAREAEARHRMAMEAYAMRLEAWADAREFDHSVSPRAATPPPFLPHRDPGDEPGPDLPRHQAREAGASSQAWS